MPEGLGCQIGTKGEKTKFETMKFHQWGLITLGMGQTGSSVGKSVRLLIQRSWVRFPSEANLCSAFYSVSPHAWLALTSSVRRIECSCVSFRLTGWYNEPWTMRQCAIVMVLVSLNMVKWPFYVKRLRARNGLSAIQIPAFIYFFFFF